LKQLSSQLLQREVSLSGSYPQT